MLRSLISTRSKRNLAAFAPKAKSKHALRLIDVLYINRDATLPNTEISSQTRPVAQHPGIGGAYGDVEDERVGLRLVQPLIEQRLGAGIMVKIHEYEKQRRLAERLYSFIFCRIGSTPPRDMKWSCASAGPTSANDASGSPRATDLRIRDRPVLSRLEKGQLLNVAWTGSGDNGVADGRAIIEHHFHVADQGCR